MLTKLRIQNIALIPEVEIEFGEGLNVLTGETGAGKSIIIGSFSFVLGEKLNKAVIRQGASFARVDAVFSVIGADIKKITQLCGVEFEDNTVILSRTLNISGKSECRVGGAVITADVLRSVAAVLVNIHGQHETEILLKPKNHMQILDSFGGQKINTIKKEYFDEFGALQSLKKSLNTFGGSHEERKRLIDMYEYQIKEIEHAKLKENEEEQLTEKKTRMMSFEKISNGLSATVSIFGGDGGIGSAMRRCINALGSISQLDHRIEKFYETAKSIKIDLDDLNNDAQEYLNSLEFDEEEFKSVDARLDEIKILKRKYGKTIGEILEFLNETNVQLNNLIKSEENIERIKNQITEQQSVVVSHAKKLNSVRKEVATVLEQNLIEQMVDLGMPSCNFKICFESGEENEPDDIEFVFSANAGEDLKPLSSIISGGEMSRFMLALKTVTANLEGVGTLVFDEIDTGISGTMGHRIAEKMSSICKFHQVIAVTHLAQIAARADRHYMIRKTENLGKTHTSVLKLNDKEHTEELTRMVGGAEFIEKNFKNN